MKNQITIAVHSFVDLITNSSSEIFVQANAGTIKAIKGMFDNVLKCAGSTKSADDLFTFELGYEVQDSDYNSSFVNKATFKKIESDFEKFEEDGGDEDSDDAPLKPVTNENEYTNVNILVTPKDKSSKEAKEVAKTLSDLTGLFEIEVTYR